MVENFRDDLIEVDGIELYPISGYANYYADLENGKIYNNDKNFWLTHNPNSLGYCYASVKNNEGVRETLSVHNLIMLARTGYSSIRVWRDAGLEVHHIDNSGKNNSVFNLELVTRKGQYQCPITKATLSNQSYKRLSKDDVVDVKKAWLNWDGTKGEFYNKWASNLLCTPRSIQNIIIGFSHKDVELSV